VSSITKELKETSLGIVVILSECKHTELCLHSSEHESEKEFLFFFKSRLRLAIHQEEEL